MIGEAVINPVQDQQEHSSAVHGHPKNTGDHNSGGIYFKIRTKHTALNITGVSMQVASQSTGSVEIFHKRGDFVGYEETSGAWISAQEMEVGSGTSNPNGHSGYEIRFDLGDTVFVERSSYHSFYIYSDLEIVSHEAEGDHQYPVGGLLTNGADMNLYVGIGSAGEFDQLQE